MAMACGERPRPAREKHCCVIGFHGTRLRAPAAAATTPTETPRCKRSRGLRGCSPASTRMTPPRVTTGLQDIHALSHEIAEWGDDPFVNNTVEPWLTPTAPQYGCTDILVIRWSGSGSRWARTRSSRRWTLTEPPRAPTGTPTLRTRSSCPGSCGPRRTPFWSDAEPVDKCRPVLADGRPQPRAPGFRQPATGC